MLRAGTFSWTPLFRAEKAVQGSKALLELFPQRPALILAGPTCLAEALGGALMLAHIYGVLSKSGRGGAGAEPDAPGGGAMDCILTESTLIEKIWLELADVVGFK